MYDASVEDQPRQHVVGSAADGEARSKSARDTTPLLIGELSPGALAQQVAQMSLSSVVQLLIRCADLDQRGNSAPQDQTCMKELLVSGERRQVCALLDNAMLQHKPQPRPTCPICFDEIGEGDVFTLACGHVFCSGCMAGHCAVVAFPICPDLECDYRFVGEEIGRAGGSERLQVFCDMQLQQAVGQLADRVVCPNPNCQNVVLCEPGVPTHVVCECGWPPFCSCCRQLYHGQRSCSEVGALREHWAQWVTEGRQQYHGRDQMATVALEDQRKAIQDNLRSQHDLERDEQYKADQCRCCPHCSRTVQKLEGCDSMKCGTDAHGGNRQNSCGSMFSWSKAPRYTPRVEQRPVQPLDFNKIRVEGRGLRHFMVMCDGCRTMHIRGPRLHCIHCPEFNVCVDCDFQSSVVHDKDHVFEVLFTPQSAHNLDLPDGTEVELVGLTRHAALNARRGFVRRFRPGSDLYEVELHGGAYVVPEELKEPPVRQPKECWGLWQKMEGFMGGQVEQPQPAAEPALPPEPALSPGARVTTLQDLPACFVQVAEEVGELVLQTLDAAEAQRAARMFHWTALPEGQSVRLFGAAPSLGRLRGFDGDAATVTGPYLLSTGCFTVRLTEESDIVVEVPATCLQPLVTHTRELAVLQELQMAQDHANQLMLDLPVGQHVELLDGPWQGRVAVITSSCCAFEESYGVRLVSPGPAPTTPRGRARALMAEEYSVADVIYMDFGRLADLWDLYCLPRDGFVSQDQFVEQALSFLPEAPPDLLHVAAGQLRPIIADLPQLCRFQEMISRACCTYSRGGDAGPAGPPVAERAPSAGAAGTGPAVAPSEAPVGQPAGRAPSAWAAAVPAKIRATTSCCSSPCFTGFAALRGKWW